MLSDKFMLSSIKWCKRALLCTCVNIKQIMITEEKIIFTENITKQGVLK